MPYCDCGCQQATGSLGGFWPGHANVLAANLRRQAGEGDQAAISELYRRGWKLASVNTPHAWGVEAEFFGISRETAVEALNDAGIDTQDDGYHHGAKSYWRVTEDGSVSHEGNELVSPILRLGKLHRSMTSQALDILRKEGAEIDTTCGLHVHHSVRGKTTKDVAETVGHWALFQELINDVLPLSRHEATYSRGMHGAQHWHDSMMAYGPTIYDLRQGAPGMGRYHAINVGSVAQHGTLEFRQHSGTLNSQKVLAWVELTRAFMDISKRSSCLGLVEAYGDEHAVRAGIKLPGMLDLLGVTEDTKKFYIARRELFAQRGGDHEDVAADTPAECEHCDCCRECCQCGAELWEDEDY